MANELPKIERVRRKTLNTAVVEENTLIVSAEDSTKALVIFQKLDDG